MEGLKKKIILATSILSTSILLLYLNQRLPYTMSASNTKLGEIAAQAERDLNTYQAKTGNARYQGVDEAGVDSMADRKFADMGAQVKYHPEISTNAGWNKRIPPEEGGERDDRGR